jgi:hypothetical protein
MKTSPCTKEIQRLKEELAKANSALAAATQQVDNLKYQLISIKSLVESPTVRAEVKKALGQT